MEEHEFLKDVEEVEKEMAKEKKAIKKEQNVLLNLFFALLAAYIIFVLVSWVIPHYITVDPPPKNIPSLKELALENENISLFNQKINVTSGQSYRAMVDGRNENIKRVANKVSSVSCEGTPLCQAKAIYFFVRDNIEYVKDPHYGEYLELPEYTLITGSGDCDDHTILLANLYQAISIPTRFVFIPGHVYIQAYIPEASFRIKDKEGWVSLDSTCRNCDFGEITPEVAKARKTIVSN